jgi:V/A-type H+-transporting ATPase subunit I
MEALARRAEVQFEWHGDRRDAEQMDALRAPVARYRQLAGRYAEVWPDPVFEKRCCDLPIDAAARDALQHLERWLADAGPQLDADARLREERAVLRAWPPVLDGLRGSRIDLGRLARTGPVLSGLCALLPKGSEWPDRPRSLATRIALGDGEAVLALVPSGEVDGLCAGVRSAGGQCLAVQTCFAGDPGTCQQRIHRRLAELDASSAEIRRGLRDLAVAHRVGPATAILERIDWSLRTATDIQCADGVCWITGWTSEPDRALLQDALREVGVDAPVLFRDPPESAASPSVSPHPAWLRPFEVFTQAIGVPGLAEADPTTWVALLVPLMFGYMCGDVGHGLVIAIAGLMLMRRTRMWPLLVFCGGAATAFGLLYGDVFGYEHLIAPLWVRPLEEPLLILMVPIVAGSLVLTLGVLLHTIQTCWRGEAGLQGVSDAAQLMVYWGLLLLIVDPRFGWLAVAGVILCVGNRLRTRPRLGSLAEGLGLLAQSTFELLLNTFSFARVGAFALAHGALQSVVIILSASVPVLPLAILVAVLGNLLVIVLETVVVTIQTTRLVLFEFFIRFFAGEGRQIEPAAPPRPGSTGDPQR